MPARPVRLLIGWLGLALACPGLLPMHAADPEKGQQESPLVRIGTGHFVVEGSANGHPLRLVVDTGCPVTVLATAAYDKLGLSPAHPPATGPTFHPRTLNHRAASIGYVADFRIGGTPLGSIAVAVTSLDSVLGAGTLADGILGADVLEKQGAVLDLGQRTLALNPDAGQAQALAQRAAQAGFVAVPMSATTGRHLAVPCILGSDPYRLVVDTGSPQTVVQRALLDPADLALPARESAMRTLDGVTTVEWLPLRHWNIGDFPVTGATVGAGEFSGGIFAEHTRSGALVAGLFGLEWLTYWQAVIDFRGRVIYLRHPGAR